MELDNSPWISVESRVAVQLQRLVVARLVVQGERLRWTLQLFQVVQLEFRLRVDLGLPYVCFVRFSFSLKAIGSFPLPPCRVIWAYGGLQ